MLNGERQTLWRKTSSLFIFFLQTQKVLASLAIVSIFCSVIVDLFQIFVGYLFLVFVFQESDPTSGFAFQPLIDIVKDQPSPLTVVFALFFTRQRLWQPPRRSVWHHLVHMLTESFPQVLVFLMLADAAQACWYMPELVVWGLASPLHSYLPGPPAALAHFD